MTINQRITRLYFAVGASEHLTVLNTLENTLDYPLGRQMSQMPNAIRSGAMTAIHSIAMLSVHCYSLSSTHGVSNVDIDSVTANCWELRIIRDLYNRHLLLDHEVSLSGFKLTLGGSRQFLAVTGGASGFTFALPLTGEEFTYGYAKPQISPLVTNEQTGDDLGVLPLVLLKGLQVWESFLAQHGISVTP